MTLLEDRPRDLRERSFAALRILFGIVWLVDALLKWTPAFLNNFSDYLTGAVQNQPLLVQQWIGFWMGIADPHPMLFAILVALIETALALSLISGAFSKYAMYCGIVFTLVIWTTAEGFGGPYGPGATDVGAAVIYALVFIALILGESWKRLNLASWIKNSA